MPSHHRPLKSLNLRETDTAVRACLRGVFVDFFQQNPCKFMKITLLNPAFWLKIMRISSVQILLLLVFAGVSLAANTEAQVLEKRVSLNMEEQEIGKTLREIEKQASVRFVYSPQVIRAGQKISVISRQEKLGELLDKMLAPLGIRYEVSGKYILLSDDRSGQLRREESSFMTLPTDPDRAVRGKVTDEKGEALPGVNVILKGTQRGTTSAADGSFELTVPDAGSNILIFSFVGYLSQEIEVGTRNILDVKLREDEKSLEEVVVVGYGTVKKSDLTGSVSSVGSAEFRETPTVDFGRALQGRASGVLVTQNSGSPGAEATIRIRGTGSINAGNDPLYVVDGFPTGSINTINPSDIESIEILKDASATAIYGSRGSNGVVIVTTKRGKAGQSNISYESYYGIQSVRRTIPLLNSRQYAEFINDARINGGGKAYFDGSSASRPLPDQIMVDTDWQDLVLRKAPIQQHQLMISGGESKTKFAISGNIYDQQGIILGSDFKRYSLRANIDRDISDRISLGLNITGAFKESNMARSDYGGGANAGVMNAALNYAPVFPVYNPDGSYYRDQSSLNGNLVDNPVGIAKEITNIARSTRILANTFLNIRILDGLVFRTSFGADLTNSKNNFYATRAIGIGMGSNGIAEISASAGTEWLNENTLTYSKTFGPSGKHQLIGLAGYTVQQASSEYVFASAINFNDDFAKYHNLSAGGTYQRPRSDVNDWALISYLSRINYGFDNRYLLTLTARMDGSSRFGPNKKYGFFPSGAFAWRLINEKFMLGQKIFSDLKLRTSYGLTGNQDIRNYAYLSLINNVRQPFGSPNPVLFTGNVPNGISNLALGWESNAQFDAGLDVAFFENRLQLTLDYYRKRTFDLLFEVNVPQTTGYSFSLRNIGEMENKGFELGISSMNIKNDAFEWSTSLNITSNRNKVLSLDGRSEFTTGAGSGHHGVDNTVLMKVGQPVGDFYGRKVIGIFQTEEEVNSYGQANARPGDLKYEDVNGDGVISNDDRSVIGNGNPLFFGGMTNQFRLKNFELNFMLQGSFGNDILNFARFDLYNLNGNNNQSVDVLDRWRPDHPSNTIPRANATGGQRIFSSFHVEDGSYLRLKNISLGFHFHNYLTRLVKLSGAKLYISAQNYLTFTRYKGFDPEVSWAGNSAISQGMDFDAYPNAKSVMVGLNLNF